MRLVVFGYGNPSRGDDALGPLLLSRLEASAFADVSTVEDFQLQIEHAIDLDGADLALFLDAGTGTPAPFGFTEVTPGGDVSHTSHALSPQAVLDVFVKIRRQPCPPAFVLCVRGDSFGLGEPLSPNGALHLEAAWDFLRDLAAAPDPVRWRGMIAG
ncbi:MAG: hydrogenase maturation protease [Bacteroidota bacterium]